MTVKIIGAILIIAGCGTFGYLLSSTYKKEETALRQLVCALDFMQCELQYRLTALPDLCWLAGLEQKGMIGQLFQSLSKELESQVSPDVSSCVRAVLAKNKQISPKLIQAFELLGSTLGRFDAQGQLKGLEYARAFCREEVEKMAQNREMRLRSYQTLGLCAGAALAILFV